MQDEYGKTSDKIRVGEFARRMSKETFEATAEGRNGGENAFGNQRLDLTQCEKDSDEARLSREYFMGWGENDRVQDERVSRGYTS